MASNALALRMKYRKFDAEKLEEIINDENSSELEVKVAQEFLDKLGGETAQEEEAPKKAPAKKVAEKKADKKAAPKKAAKEEAAEDPDPEDGSPEAAMKRQNKRNSTYQSEEQLTPEEEERLAKCPHWAGNMVARLWHNPRIPSLVKSTGMPNRVCSTNQRCISWRFFTLLAYG